LALILADSDVLIDYLNGVQPIVRQVQEFIGSDGLHTSAINCFELLSGAAETERGKRTRALVESLPILPVDREAAAIAASIRRNLAQIGRSIGMADSLIAGVAQSNNIPLFTRNHKHFSQVEGLVLVLVEV
jgi:predicted nucleic acid-binding protein